MSPFKSKKQMAKFEQLEKEGKLPKGTAEKWRKETKSIDTLPEYAPKQTQFKINKVKVIK